MTYQIKENVTVCKHQKNKIHSNPANADSCMLLQSFSKGGYRERGKQGETISRAASTVRLQTVQQVIIQPLVPFGHIFLILM